MMQVSERTVRTARKVREKAPTNLTRLVEEGRIKLNAIKACSRLSTEDKQRIEGMTTMTQRPRSSASTRRAPPARVDGACDGQEASRSYDVSRD